MLKLVAAIVATRRHGRLKLVRAVVREPPKSRRLCQGFQTPFDPSIHSIWTPAGHSGVVCCRLDNRRIRPGSWRLVVG